MATKIFPKLEALSFYVDSVPDNRCLRRMLSRARRLRYLSLNESSKAEFYEDETIDEDGPGLLEVLAPTNSLSACSFRGYVNLRPKSLEYILRNFSDTLEYLNLSGTNLEGLTNMSTDSLPELNKMKVFIAAIYPRQKDVEELPHSLHTRCSQQLVALLKLMPNLRVLNLSQNYHLRFNGVDIVSLLSEHCPLLEELHLTKCAVPAEKLLNLPKLKFLKRLILGVVHDRDLSYSEIDAATNLVECFKFLTYRILPHMSNLEELSIEDPTHAFPADDIVAFIDTAGPKFKTLTVSAMYDIVTHLQTDFDTRHNFIEEAARKCKEICKDRDNAIKLLVYGIAFLHRNSCNTVESRKDCNCGLANFDDIAPKFLRISPLEYNEEYGYEDYYPNNASQDSSIKIDNGFFKLPRFLGDRFLNF